LTDEKNYYKAMMLKLKVQYDDAQIKINYYKEEFSKINEIKKVYEDRHNSLKFEIINLKSKIREKELKDIQFNNDIDLDERNFVDKLFEEEQQKKIQTKPPKNNRTSIYSRSKPKKKSQVDSITSKDKNRDSLFGDHLTLRILSE